MLVWNIQVYENGVTITAQSETEAKPPILEHESLEAAIDYCDTKLAEEEERWNESPEARKGNDFVLPELIEIPETWSDWAKESPERFNDHVNEYNKEVEKWTSLKTELEARQ